MSDQLKNFLIIICILIVIACYHDLQMGSNKEAIHAENLSYSHYDPKPASFQVVSYQIQQGEQFLTIVEKLNNQQVMDIEQIIDDFHSLNPSADIYQLEGGQIYLFPVYQTF